MRELYGLKSKVKNTDKPEFRLENINITNILGSLSIEQRTYGIISELPSHSEEKIITLLGYIESSKKGNQHCKTKGNGNKVVGYINSEFPIHQNPSKGQKVIGYVKVEGIDSYIGVTEKKSKAKFVIPVVAAIMMIALVGFNLYESPMINQPADINSFVQGEKGTGEFEEEETTVSETLYFNQNLNITPTIYNNQMNIRVINSKTVQNKENTLKCVVEVSLLGKADNNGDLIEVYDEPIIIYESPLLNPSENIETCVVKEGIEAGRYVGRATYYIYDSNLYPIGKTAARLDIVAK